MLNLFSSLVIWSTLIALQPNSIDSLLSESKIGKASCSITAMDAATGKILYETQQKSQTPASVMKVMTTVAALEILGKDFTFATSLERTGKVDQTTLTLKGDLILKGGCDPAFYSSYFEEHYQNTFQDWAARLKISGVETIEGNLFYDLTSFDGRGVPGGWVLEDVGNYYGAGISALSYADNFYSIHFSTGDVAGKPAVIHKKEPEIQKLNLINRVISSSEMGDKTIIWGTPGSYYQVIDGTIPTGQKDFVVKGSMPDPAKLAADTFLKILQKEGIRINGKVAELPSGYKPVITSIFTKKSPALTTLIVPLNQESINLFAEHLFIELGRVRKGEASVVAGKEAINQYCVENGISNDGFFPEDGSGLSRSNLITSRTLTETLKHVYDSPSCELFFQSLPLAGKSGTLVNSFIDTPLEGNLQAKSGSMTRVRNLTGKFKSKSGRTILFAILFQNFSFTGKEAGKFLEEVVLEMYGGM